MRDESFTEFVLDQLGALPEVRAKATFGGYGLYQADRLFGILMDGRLYSKTDEQTRTAYVGSGLSLKEDEIQDLVAFLLSRGDRNSKAFH